MFLFFFLLFSSSSSPGDDPAGHTRVYRWLYNERFLRYDRCLFRLQNNPISKVLHHAFYGSSSIQVIYIRFKRFDNEPTPRERCINGSCNWKRLFSNASFRVTAVKFFFITFSGWHLSVQVDRERFFLPLTKPANLYNLLLMRFQKREKKWEISRRRYWAWKKEHSNT